MRNYEYPRIIQIISSPLNQYAISDWGSKGNKNIISDKIVAMALVEMKEVKIYTDILPIIEGESGRYELVDIGRYIAIDSIEKYKDQKEMENFWLEQS